MPNRCFDYAIGRTAGAVVGDPRKRFCGKEGWNIMREREISKVAVIGAGEMGHGIAQEFAQGGFDVRLHARTEEKCADALARIRANLDLFVRHDLLSSGEADQAMSRITGETDFARAVGDADLVLESVPESLPLKQEIFGRVERFSPSHAILVSNTSSLSVDGIASGITCPERFVVAHHFSPPHIVSVVEVVPGSKTGPEVVKTTSDVLRRCGKVPVVLRKDAPGFIANRLQVAILREAMSIVAQGIASAEDVDTVMELSLARRLTVTGPLKRADLVGLDHYRDLLWPNLAPHIESSIDLPAFVLESVKRGDCGMRTGKGYYEWTPETVAKVMADLDNDLIDRLKSAGR